MPGHLAPRQREHLVHLACFMPFDKVAQMMEEMVSVQTHEETVRRLTEQAGSWIEAAQLVAVEAGGASEPENAQPLERCAFSADGAMISLVKKQWVETRTVAIGEPQEKLNADGEREIHVGKLSYFSRLADAITFSNLAEVEIRRRKVREAKEVCAVMDGADWLQFFTDRHRPDAVRILDFPHAAEHVTKLLEALEQAGMRFPPHMLDRCLHVLKHRGPHVLQRIAERLGSDLAAHKGAETHLDYLRKREALMQYPQFRRNGWPIGSGMVESANKNVVEARLKGPGMHWQRKNVNPLLALRNAVCNDRWREMWPKALTQHRKLRVLQREAQAEQRARTLLAGGHASSQEAPSSSAALKPAPPPALSQPASKAEPLALPLATPLNVSDPSRVNASHQRSGEVRTEACFCGAPLVHTLGRRTKSYCSGRCRMRAYRDRQQQIPQLSPSMPATTQGTLSLQQSPESEAERCPCGTPLVHVKGGRTKGYCSGRCRQRAYRERQRWRA